AVDDGGDPVVEGRCGRNLGPDRLPRNRAEEFASLLDDLFRPGIDGVTIGMVHPGQVAVYVAAPDRLLDGVEKTVEQGNGAGQPLTLDLQFRKFGAQVVERDEADECLAAGHAALYFEDL